MTADAPTWFLDALAEPGESGRVTVAGAEIHHLSWGERDAPTLVLVHGGAAHAHWWSALAPLLARDHRVVAIDLSGHGDSDHRDDYPVETWAEEVLAVAADAGGTGRPTVVGHSMGGVVTITAAARFGEHLAGAIVCDAPMRESDPESAEARRDGRNMFRSMKSYPDLETALQHFHLVPPQPTRNLWLIDHIARHSLHDMATDGGDGSWTWKFDPGIFFNRRGPVRASEYGEELARAACRLAVVTGERSTVADEHVVEHMRALVAGSPAAAAGVPFVAIPDAHHHLLLDEPLATVTALRAILATWAPVGTGPRPVTAS